MAIEGRLQPEISSWTPSRPRVPPESVCLSPESLHDSTLSLAELGNWVGLKKKKKKKKTLFYIKDYMRYEMNV